MRLMRKTTHGQKTTMHISFLILECQVLLLGKIIQYGRVILQRRQRQ